MKLGELIIMMNRLWLIKISSYAMVRGDCLKNIKGSGSFASSSTAVFFFPGLEVDNLGELSYPINELWHHYTPENFLPADS